MEALERGLDLLMRERLELVAALERERAGGELAAPLFGFAPLLSAVDALKFAGFACWSFFLLRFLFAADLREWTALLGGVAFVALMFGFSIEEHAFFWPFAALCLAECGIALVQATVIVVLALRFHGDIDRFMNAAQQREATFSNAVLNEMTTWSGVVGGAVYCLLKLLGFGCSLGLASRVGVLYARQDARVEAAETRLALNHHQMAALLQRLELLRHSGGAWPPAVLVEDSLDSTQETTTGV
ncbi:hypothetical protein M3Y99_01879000 [Aphelenchoides fujianensis]|nr:hypothetical protein M3Y99_01879000 [Aphelenchoides fujianensis]